MKKNILQPALAAAMLLAACSQSNKEQTSADTASVKTGKADSVSFLMPTADNSANALDWPGTYQGILPCADCEGIETSLTLRADSSYSLRTRYRGKKDAAAGEQKGTFAWNAAGSTIRLSGIRNAPDQYLVGENQLIQLDMQGNRITGALEKNYVLSRQPAVAPMRSGLLAEASADTTLAGVYWKLTTLMGKPVQDTPRGKTMYVQFNEKEGRVQGNGGCNGFFGSYTTENNYRIRFSKMGSTMMACPRLELEREYLQVFEKTDSYIIKGNRLQLIRARMAPLAEFEAVKAP